MSEFKFACPKCGQHITCDSAKSSTQLDCPTCFQKLIVPNAPQGKGSNLVLNASLAESHRPSPSQSDTTVLASAKRSSSAGWFPAIVIFVLVCAVGAVFAFRKALFKGSSVTGHGSTNTASFSNAPPANDTNWTLSLAGVTIPDRRVAGRINGRVFSNPKVLVKENALTFRQGPELPPDLALTIVLPVNDGWELSNKSFNVQTNQRGPTVLLRWKDDRQHVVKNYLGRGYALRLEFGQVLGDHLPGKICFCAPDDAKSYVLGTFDAVILLSPPPPPQPPRPHRPHRRKL